MPPISECSREYREEDEESGFGELPCMDLDLPAVPELDETVGSHAAPPAPRPNPPAPILDLKQETRELEVSQKLATDLRLSDDEVAERELSVSPPDTALSAPVQVRRPSETPQASKVLPSRSRRHIDNALNSSLTLEPSPISPPPLDSPGEEVIEEVPAIDDMGFGDSESWSQPPETFHTSATPLDTADDLQDSGSSDSSLSSCSEGKIEVRNIVSYISAILPI